MDLIGRQSFDFNGPWEEGSLFRRMVRIGTGTGGPFRQ